MQRVVVLLLLVSCATQPRASNDRPATTGRAVTAPESVPRDPSAVWPDEGPSTWPPRPTTAAITANDLRTRLYAFAHDSMEGRRIGEPGNHKGTEAIAAEFARLGLKPAGDDGTYFQEMPFGPLGIDVATSRLAIGAVPLAAKRDWVPIVPTMGGELATEAAFTNVPTVFAGRWGDSIALSPERFRGKVAVFVATASAPGMEAPPRPAPVLPRCDSLPDMFGAAAAAKVEAERRASRLPPATRTFFGPATRRDARAQQAGAVGVLIVLPGALPTSAVAQAFAQRMVMQPSGTAGRGGIGGALVSPEVAGQLFGRMAETVPFGASGRVVNGGWSQRWQQSTTPARNVIAILPGSDPARAGEYVLVGAHSDHVGVNADAVDHDSLRAVNIVTRRQGANDPACRPTAQQQHAIDSLIARARSIRPPRRDSIMNGADDDGSGTVVMLEIAERFASEQPARSIIFISHQGEEGGLLGSRWFVDHPTVPLTSIVAAHNMDMVGKGRVEQVKFGGPASLQLLGARRLSREFGDIIDSVNAVRAEVMALDKSWEVKANPLNRFCRSDQVNYVRKDIPVTYFSLGYAQDYHQPTDEAPYVDYEHAARVGRFIHDVMWAIAERRERPAIAGPDPDFPVCR